MSIIESSSSLSPIAKLDSVGEVIFGSYPRRMMKVMRGGPILLIKIASGKGCRGTIWRFKVYPIAKKLYVLNYHTNAKTTIRKYIGEVMPMLRLIPLILSTRTFDGQVASLSRLASFLKWCLDFSWPVSSSAFVTFLRVIRFASEVRRVHEELWR